MFSITACPLPPATSLQRYRDTGAYTDCFSTEIDAEVSLGEFVDAFYTTWLFRLERFVLRVVAKIPSQDIEVSELAAGRISRFAAWRVEDRAARQLLMCDLRGRTRSWFMVEAKTVGAAKRTRLYFGSAVTRVPDPRSGTMSLGFVFTALLGFHRLYSRLLLHAARSRIETRRLTNSVQ